MGALGSAYFFDVGQNSDSSLPSDVSLDNNVGNGYLNTTLLKGNPDAIYILKNGTTEKTANSPVVGDSYSIQASQGTTLAVVVQIDGSNTTVFHTTVSTGSAISNNNIGTLTWNTSSDWDNATTNDVLHSSDTVTMVYNDDFEDGNMGRFEKYRQGGGQVAVKEDSALYGQYSLAVYSPNNDPWDAAYTSFNWDNMSIAADHKLKQSIDGDTTGIMLRFNDSNEDEYEFKEVRSNGKIYLKSSDGDIYDSKSKSLSGVTRFRHTIDGDKLTGYINGTKELEGTISGSTFPPGAAGFRAGESDMRVDNVTVRSLDGSIVTENKSFNSAIKPDIKDISYSLNGQSINVTVIGSPETASEEKKTVQLDGSSSYSLSWTESHKKFRIKIEMDGTQYKSPTFSSIELGT